MFCCPTLRTKVASGRLLPPDPHVCCTQKPAEALGDDAVAASRLRHRRHLSLINALSLLTEQVSVKLGLRGLRLAAAHSGNKAAVANAVAICNAFSAWPATYSFYA